MLMVIASVARAQSLYDMQIVVQVFGDHFGKPLSAADDNLYVVFDLLPEYRVIVVIGPKATYELSEQPYLAVDIAASVVLPGSLGTDGVGPYHTYRPLCLHHSPLNKTEPWNPTLLYDPRYRHLRPLVDLL